MNRNLFFISSIILFVITLYALNNWIAIIDVPQAKSVYMSNKKSKIVNQLFTWLTSCNWDAFFDRFHHERKGRF